MCCITIILLVALSLSVAFRNNFRLLILLMRLISFPSFVYFFVLVKSMVCSQPCVGFLYEKSQSDPNVEILSKSILNDFLNQISSNGYTQTPIIFNSSTNKEGIDITRSLDDFRKNNVKHIFSSIIFSNFTLINQQFSEYGMVLWSSSAQLFEACNSNVVYYGSLRKIFEQCID